MKLQEAQPSCNSAVLYIKWACTAQNRRLWITFSAT